MQAYGAGFARVYNLRWSGFARQVAPLILEYFEVSPFAAANKRVLDLCCGTGQLALYFLEKGYRVVGIASRSICCAMPERIRLRILYLVRPNSSRKRAA